jgi:hypothetical protein
MLRRRGSPASSLLLIVQKLPIWQDRRIISAFRKSPILSVGVCRTII